MNGEKKHEANKEIPQSNSHQPEYDTDDFIRFTREFWIWIQAQKIPAAQWIQAIASVALIFVTVGQLVVSCSSSAQTDTLIKQATRQGNAAESFSASAGEIKTGINNAVEKLQLQANQVKRSVDEVVSTDRAFVFVRSIDAVHIPDRAKDDPRAKDFNEHNRFIIFVNWQNSGATPTKELRIRAGCSDSPFKGESVNERTGIGPKGEDTQNPCSVSPYHILSENYNSRLWYVWGRATYKDVFGGYHLTEFCKEGLNRDDIETPVITWTGCRRNPTKFNCADKECEDYKSYMKPNATP